MQRDLRLAFRQLFSTPGYTIAATITLALAIGASTAIFSAVYAVLLEPAAMRNPQDLVVAWGTGPTQAMKVIELSYLDIRDLGEATPGIGPVAAVGSSSWGGVLEGSGDPVKLSSVGVSGNFFELVGAVPALGRAIQPSDDLPNSAPVIVISRALWVGRFGSDTQIVGRRVQFDGQPHEIVGVMPATFDYPRGTDVWRAIAPVLGDGSGGGNPNPLRNVGVLFMVGRLNAGVTLPVANAEWSGALERVLAGSQGPKYGLTVTPFLDYEVGPARRALVLLLAAVAVLLLIACANVSGLMLTRVSLRAHHDAVRLAMGGTRTAIARLWAAETIWLTLFGSVAGLLLCRWLIAAIVALAPEGIPRLDQVAIDRPILLFAIGLMAFATLLCAAAPMRQSGMTDLGEILSDASRTIAGRRSYRARSVLLVAQVAMAVVLLIGAALVARSFDALRRVDLGFTPDGVLRLSVQPRDLPRERVNQWIAQLLEHVRGIDGVDSAGAVYLTPMELGSIGQGTWVVAEGQPETPETANSNPMLNYLSATPDYFATLRIPLKQGRLFTSDDRASVNRVAIISESTARALFPGQNPIGKRIKSATFTARRDPLGDWRTIIGVVGDVRYRGLAEVQLDMYDPPMQTLTPTTSIVVRTSAGSGRNPLSIASTIAAQARALDRQVLISNISTLDQVVDREMAPWRFSAWVFSSFAAMAFILSMVGLFSLVSLDVANRQHELAVRMAIGASPDRLVNGVFVTAVTRGVIGVALGLLAAAGARHAVESLLYGVSSGDAITYALVAGLVLAVVAVASYAPARKAAATDPLLLLRR